MSNPNKVTFNFSDQVALVTGAGGGIGRAISLAFARAGARLVCVDIDSKAVLATATEITAMGGKVLSITADVTSTAAVQEFVEKAVQEFGRIDIFANNAGYEGVVRSVSDYPDDEFDKVIAINVKGIFLGLKFVIPVMTAQGNGVIINTGSTGSHTGAPGVCAYTAAKHAVLGLTRTAALEVADQGIRINAVCPGGTKTRMIDSLTAQRDSSDFARFSTATPNGRSAEPEEVADLVLFMASENAKHLVGQSIILDGGRLAM